MHRDLLPAWESEPVQKQLAGSRNGGSHTSFLPVCETAPSHVKRAGSTPTVRPDYTYTTAQAHRGTHRHRGPETTSGTLSYTHSPAQCCRPQATEGGLREGEVARIPKDFRPLYLPVTHFCLVAASSPHLGGQSSNPDASEAPGLPSVQDI